MNPLRQSILVLGLLLATALFLNGCNTTKGLGKDVERVGEKIQQKASR